MAKTKPEPADDDDDGRPEYDGGFERLTALAAEIEAHTKRLKKEGKFDAAAELKGTVMSLLEDLGKLTAENLGYFRKWAAEVEEELWDADDDEDDDAVEGVDDDDLDDESALAPEDASLLSECLVMLREYIISSRQIAPESTHAQIDEALGKVEKAIARVAEITLIDDPDDDAGESDAEPGADGEPPLPDGQTN